MKNDRQQKILAIIENEAIETQEQLIERLRQSGVTSTQATISRDIKQMHIIKEPTGGGKYRYAVSEQKTKLNFADRLRTILHESIVNVDFAQNLVVLKTMPGTAAAAGAALEAMGDKRIVGCLAGDNTVLIIVRDNSGAEALCQEIRTMRK